MPLDDRPPTPLDGLTERELQRLRMLAQRYRVRADTTLRQIADVAYDLQSRHGVDLTHRQVFELLTKKEPER